MLNNTANVFIILWKYSGDIIDWVCDDEDGADDINMWWKLLLM